MSENEESLDNPEIAAEYERYCDTQIDMLSEDFETWLREVSERVDDLENRVENTPSQKQRIF